MSTTEPAKKSKKCSFAAFDMFGSPVAFNIRGDETYKTVIGCFWTFIMVLSIVAAFVWYFMIFVNKSDGEVSSTIETLDVYPKLDFYNSGFFLSIYANKGKKVVPLDDLKDSFKIEATMHEETRTDGDVNAEPTEAEPRIIPFEPCVDAGFDEAKPGAPDQTAGKELEGKKGTSLSNNALCSVATQDNPVYMEGADEDETFSYFRIKIMPCSKTVDTCIYYYAEENMYNKVEKEITDSNITPGDIGRYVCSVLFTQKAKDVHKRELDPPVNPDPTTCDCGNITPAYPNTQKILYFSGSTPPTLSTLCNDVLKRAPDKVKEDTGETFFTLSYTEGSVKPDNYEEPFSFFLKTGARIYGSVENTKLINMYWKEVEVQTDKGLIMENIQTQTSMSLDYIITDTLDRGEGATKKEKLPGGSGGKESVDLSYIEFTLYSSNNKLIFVRKYSKLVDVFANIGGIAEVLGFVVVFCYAWYNGIRMEQKLLNYGVLNKKQKRDESNHKNGTGNDDEEWEKKRHFSFGELVKLGLMEKGIGCCFKSKKMKKRQEFYEEVKESFEQRTDVINIMKGVSDVDTLKEALLTPYQLRLMHYLATRKDDDETNEKQMSINDATKELNKSLKKLTPIQELMDSYLKAHLPANVLSGNYTEDLDFETEKMVKGRVVPLDSNITELNNTGGLKVPNQKGGLELMSPSLSPRIKGLSKRQQRRMSSSSKSKLKIMK